MRSLTQETCAGVDGHRPSLDYIFHPRSVAVVGASPNPKKRGNEYLKWQLDNGYRGELYPVNPRGGEISGLRVYPRLADIPGPVDEVISCIPAEQVPQLVKECVAKGVKLIHLHTAGFSETGDEARAKLELEALEAACRAGIRVIGPNCMGLHCPSEGLSFSSSTQRHWKESGTVGYFSQSGGNAGELMNRGSIRGIHFSKVVSYGNACDLNEVDFLDYFAQDPDTEIICAYMEGARDGRGFVAALKEAASRKPVIILKGGRTEAGTRAVASHTGSLAGSNQVWDALIRQAGAIRVYNLEEMADLALTFVFVAPPRGRRMGIIGMGGGASVQAADDCAVEGLQVPPFPAELRRKLRVYSPEAGTSIRNPLEGSMVRGPDLVEIIRLIDGHHEVDTVGFNINVDFSSGRAGRDAEYLALLDTLVETWPKATKPWAVVFHTAGSRDSQEAVDEARDRMWDIGLPVYRSMASAARALSRFIGWHEGRE